MEYDLNYPVISFTKGNNIHFARHTSDLTICSKRGFKKGFYNGLSIVDSSGKLYKIEKAERLGNYGFLFGLNIWLEQRLRVKLLFSSIKEIPLQEFKDKIIKSLNKDEYFWNSDGEINAKRTFVNNAKDFKEIINYLTELFYKKY